MSQRSAREKYHHDKMAVIDKGRCWANATSAGQLRQDIRAKMAIDYISRSPGKKILEIGCGNGEFSKRFLNTGMDMYCMDISPELISALSRQYDGTNLKFEVADAESLPYKDDYFDGVTGNGVLHHLNIDICLKEIHRVLKKGGKIFFSEPNILNPEVFLETKIRWIGKIAQKTEDEQAFSRWPLETKLQEIGFKNVRVVPFDFLQPLTPKPLISIVQKVGSIFEKIPVIRELAGSLKITGEKS